eukprot:221911-Ditylum_brightwellii.AAC.1
MRALLSWGELFIGLQDDYPNEENLMLQDGQRFVGLHHHLAKMYAWADAFPDIAAPLYESIKKHLNGFLCSAAIAASGDIDNSQSFLALSSDQLQNH